MSEKLSERMTVACTAYCSLFAPEVAALEQQLAAKNEELAEADENNNSLSRCLAERGNVIAAKDAEIARLQEAANKLAWACEVQITTTNNSRAFRNQHKEKCRYWIAQMRAALAETPATPIRQCKCDVDKGYRDPGCVHCIPKSETPAAPKEPRVILPPHVKHGFCDRHNRKWEEIDTGDGFAFTCRECRNERIKSHDAPLTALALPEDDVPDAAPEAK